MKLTLAEPKLFRESISIISDLVNEVTFKIDKDKIEIIAMDPANVAMIIFKLLSSAFTEYDIKKEQKIAINLNSLKQILRRVKPSDILSFDLDEEKNRLKIRIKGESTRTFNLALIDIEQKEQKLPNLNFPVEITSNSLIFNEAIEDMDIIAESVELVAYKDKLVVQAESSLNNAQVEIPIGKETVIKMNSTEPIKSKYSIEYLKKIIKGAKLANTVNIKFNKDYPLKLGYTIRDKLDFSVILAPRVENS